MPVSISGTNGVTFPDSSLQAAAASPYVLKNRIINGAMQIDQRNAGASVAITTVNQYVVDRFAGQIVGAGTGRFSLQQSTTTPASGFKNSLVATVTTTDSSPSAGYGYAIYQRIEGNNVADLNWGTANAQTVTLSFWVRSSLTGTFGVVLQNSSFSRAYGATYTISSANTWEQKSITISGDTTGTWAVDNTVGLDVAFSLGGGSSRTVSSGWQSNAGSYQTNVTGAINWIGTSGATFYITGVQLEVGTSATPFERRLYNQELANCQRYYFKNKAVDIDSLFGSGFNESTTVAYGMSYFPVPMRTNPTALEQTGTASDYRIRTTGATNTTCNGVPALIGASTQIAWVQYPVASGLTAGQGSLPRANTTAAFLAWSAEL
jgi:hypothetical protein